MFSTEFKKHLVAKLAKLPFTKCTLAKKRTFRRMHLSQNVSWPKNKYLQQIVDKRFFCTLFKNA